VIVRPALTRDLDAIVRLGMDSVRYHASLEPSMEVARDEWRKMHERFEVAIRDGEQSTVIIAELDGAIAGFYSIYVQAIDDTWTPPLFASGRYGLIAEVAVDAPLRGRGIGHQIFAEVDRWFTARRVPCYWLIYLPHNPLSSKFWPSLGFRTVWEVLLRDR
ncbi:MAG: GNAT family N-acetyltransferase, partial [Chloroflexi bacterium]|nr:GNAT family N-acetyltransferase [Chloroflexota bacterium]